jgi:SAM-dependent methyltransferase
MRPDSDPHDPRDGLPPPTDDDRYTIAGVYDVFLNGTANRPGDRAKAAEIEAWLPGVRELVKANREFVGFAVTSMAERGHRQFLDVGSGLPTPDNTHGLAQAVAPDSVVVYVDNDPEVVALGLALLAGPGVAVIEGDAARPAEILRRALALGLITLAAPVVVLMTCVLHFLPGDLGPLLDEWYDLLPARSMLVITHGAGEDHTRQRAAALYAQTPSGHTVRSPDEIAGWFERGTWHLLSIARVENFTVTMDGEIRVEGEGEGRAPRAGPEPDGYLAALIAEKV